MTRTIPAIYENGVFRPTEPVGDLPEHSPVQLTIEPAAAGSLSDLPACGLWADRTDLDDTVSDARKLRRSVEMRQDHAT